MKEECALNFISEIIKLTFVMIHINVNVVHNSTDGLRLNFNAYFLNK